MEGGTCICVAAQQLSNTALPALPFCRRKGNMSVTVAHGITRRKHSFRRSAPYTFVFLLQACVVRRQAWWAK